MATSRRVAGRRRPGRPRAARRGSRDNAARAAASRLIDTESQKLGHVGSWEWDAVRNVVTWSEELYRIYGIDRRQFGGTYEGFLRHVYRDDRARTREVIAAAFREGRPFDFEHRIVRGDGAVRVLKTRGGVVRGPSGAVVRLAGCCMDVTEQWETGRRLDESLAALRATLNATADGIFVVDLEGKITAFNRRAIELWSIPEALVARGDRSS